MAFDEGRPPILWFLVGSIGKQVVGPGLGWGGKGGQAGGPSSQAGREDPFLPSGNGSYKPPLRLSSPHIVISGQKQWPPSFLPDRIALSGFPLPGRISRNSIKEKKTGHAIKCRSSNYSK